MRWYNGTNGTGPNQLRSSTSKLKCGLVHLIQKNCDIHSLTGFFVLSELEWEENHPPKNQYGWFFLYHEFDDLYHSGCDTIFFELLLMLQKSGGNAPVEVGSLSHHLQGFIYARWCRISSINSSSNPPEHVGDDEFLYRTPCCIFGGSEIWVHAPCRSAWE